MIVTQTNFQDCLRALSQKKILAVDTETTGLRPYHGDKLFSIPIASSDETYYFNFKDYEGDPAYPRDAGLSTYHMAELAKLLKEDRTYFMHNAKFDLAMLANEGVTVGGIVWCTLAQARVVYNNHMDYSLEACASRIGFEKDSAVEDYIEEHDLWEWQTIPGKKQREKNKFYDRVPFDIISKYAQTDARITFELGMHQKQAVEELSSESTKYPGMPPLSSVASNEIRLTRTVSKMESTGLRIDRDYCVRAAQYEADRAEKAVQAFQRETGKAFCASNKLFQTVFASDRERWEYTDKNNPSFNSDTLITFQNPAAKLVLEYRDAKSKSDFYQGFIYHADSRGIVHPHLNAEGTATGRFSSSNPNFQNLTSDENEDLTQEFVVRRAVIPREGCIFFMPDYEQMEYKLSLELACRLLDRSTPLADQVRGGADFHQAVTDMANEVTGREYKRKAIKNVNFAKIYGAGIEKLMLMLGCTTGEVMQLVRAINRVAPEIDVFCEEVIKAARYKGFVFNWLGRRCNFPDRNFAYKAPNYLVQGGCADVVKIAMNHINDLLSNFKSNMILQVHDELLIEMPEDEAHVIPKLVQEIMVNAFPAKYLPLTSSAEWSNKSMADKIKGYPV